MKLILLLTLSSALCYGQVPEHQFIDTPLADRNPNDFYFGDYITPDTNTHYSVKYNLTKEQADSVDNGQIILLYRPKLSLEEKLLLYASECYNDSTVNTYTVHLVEGGVDADDDSDSATACMIYFDKCINPNHRYEIRSETIHREPTFKGFLEYLKQK